MIEIFFKYGNTPESVIAWVSYGHTLVSEYGDLEMGYKIGEAAIEMRNKFGNQEIRSKFWFHCLASTS